MEQHAIAALIGCYGVIYISSNSLILAAQVATDRGNDYQQWRGSCWRGGSC